MTLVWLPEAQQDVGRLFDFIVEVNPTAAERAIRPYVPGRTVRSRRSSIRPECLAFAVTPVRPWVQAVAAIRASLAA